MYHSGVMNSSKNVVVTPRRNWVLPHKSQASNYVRPDSSASSNILLANAATTISAVDRLVASAAHERNAHCNAI